jgi:hypothetical protein
MGRYKETNNYDTVLLSFLKEYPEVLKKLA